MVAGRLPSRTEGNLSSSSREAGRQAHLHGANSRSSSSRAHGQSRTCKPGCKCCSKRGTDSRLSECKLCSTWRLLFPAKQAPLELTWISKGLVPGPLTEGSIPKQACVGEVACLMPASRNTQGKSLVSARCLLSRRTALRRPTLSWTDTISKPE